MAISTASPADVVRAYFEAVGAGDRERLVEVLRDDIVYRFPGASPFARVYEGRDQVLAYLDRLRDYVDDGIDVTVREVFTGTQGGAGWVRAEAAHNGRSFSWNLVGVITCDDTAISEIALYYDDQYGVDDFLAGAGA